MSAGFRGDIGISFSSKQSAVRQNYGSEQEQELLALGKELLSTSFIKSIAIEEDIRGGPVSLAASPARVIFTPGNCSSLCGQVVE